MIFTAIDTPADDYTILERYSSENGVWYILLRQQMFGIRVSASREPDHNRFYHLDYCGGAHWSVIEDLQDVIIRWLSQYPESLTGVELEDMCPKFERRPMNLDPVCFAKLRALADKKVDAEPALA